MMTPKEKKATLCLAGIYAFRMLGLFMILPIFSLYTHQLLYANATLIGLALGIYGLTQALFQLPFAMISDRIGRKPVIVFGLILFVLGSVVAALSHNIYWIIVGRAIQGAGAVGSTLIALLADTTEDEHRLKAMSMIGMTIGFSFMVAIILGPILDGWFGLSGIFWLTAGLACLGILMLRMVPTPDKHVLHRDSEPVLSQFKNILLMPELLRLNFGIFASHAILMSMFVVLPMILVGATGLHENQQWMVYLPVLIIACAVMMPFVIIAEAKRLIKPIFIGAIFCVTLAQGLFEFFHQNIFGVALIMCLFFTAFTLLEGILPSLVSKIAPAGNKGTAMGIYSTSQFLGIFCGGSLGGLIYSDFGAHGLFMFSGFLGLLWLLLAITMKQPPYLSSKILTVGVLNDTEAAALQLKLLAMPGVKDVMISKDEGIAYLKVDKKELAADAF
jgi:MFS family permease